jgi:hypothetical protein
MTHSLDQKVMTRKAMARKCTAEINGDIQAKVEKQHRLIIISCHISNKPYNYIWAVDASL